jgi:uncharacterized protein
MTRDEAIGRLQRHETELRRLGVERLFLFGSTARGEAREDSDVDLFFDYQKGKLGVFELMDVKACAADILGVKADIPPATACTNGYGRKSKPQPCAYSDGRSVLRASAGGHDRSHRTHPTHPRRRPARQVRKRLGAAVARRARRRDRFGSEPPSSARTEGPPFPWRKVAGIGNELRHDYESIAAPVLWKLASKDLDALEQVCRVELSALQQNG